MKKEQSCKFGDQTWWFSLNGQKLVLKTKWPDRKNRVSYTHEIPITLDGSSSEDVYDEVMAQILSITFGRLGTNI